MTDMALQAMLAKFAPHRDGGGAVTFVLDDLQWHTFMTWLPTLHTTYALARLTEEGDKDG